MKKLAARDFEDFLQCAIPAFGGLLDDKNNEVILNLLFELATWHALAKLRLHTESTVCELESSTTRLGRILRKFAKSTCEEFITFDLPSEEAARGRRKAARATKNPTGSTPQTTSKGKQKAKQRKPRKFNMCTYKMHALGNYARCIRLFGPSDGYSTQTGELEHRRCKRFYPRVHKGKSHYKRGIAKHVHREHAIHNIGKELDLDMSRPMKRRKLSTPDGQLETGFAHTGLPQAPPQQRYQLPERSHHIVMLDVFLRENRRDPAVKDFLPHLRDHLLARILHREYDGNDTPFSDAQRAEVQFRGRKLYQHKVLRINYTTYDLRREQDSINPRTYPNIMVLRPDGPDPHPYWYARIIRIFHIVVNHPNLSDSTHMDFLWVRWFGFKARRLHRIGFVKDTNDPDVSPAFGFVDPCNVIRAVYLPPVYEEGKRTDLLSRSMARLPSENDEDFCLYYVNFFADRDLFMRFFGGSVGHSTTREASTFFQNDRHPSSSPRTHRRDPLQPDQVQSPTESEDNLDISASETEATVDETKSGFREDEDEDGDEDGDELEDGDEDGDELEDRDRSPAGDNESNSVRSGMEASNGSESERAGPDGESDLEDDEELSDGHRDQESQDDDDDDEGPGNDLRDSDLEGGWDNDDEVEALGFASF
ncbi:hypothetical protein EDB83DRAFT_2448378 [Lactarius deliciosus]|nr:hypothetical protein EDB83DRAFT_2448378 [Lactarius deliciosus]